MLLAPKSLHGNSEQQLTLESGKIKVVILDRPAVVTPHTHNVLPSQRYYSGQNFHFKEKFKKAVIVF